MADTGLLGQLKYSHSCIYLPGLADGKGVRVDERSPSPLQCVGHDVEVQETSCGQRIRLYVHWVIEVRAPFTHSTPLAVSSLARRLSGLRVRARTAYGDGGPSSEVARRLSITARPCAPVAPTTKMILLPVDMVSSDETKEVGIRTGRRASLYTLKLMTYVVGCGLSLRLFSTSPFRRKTSGHHRRRHRGRTIRHLHDSARPAFAEGRPALAFAPSFMARGEGDARDCCQAYVRCRLFSCAPPGMMQPSTVRASRHLKGIVDSLMSTGPVDTSLCT